MEGGEGVLIKNYLYNQQHYLLKYIYPIPPSEGRHQLEILLLSTNIKSLFLRIKEIFLLNSSKTDSGIVLFHKIADTKTFNTPCDTHFTAAFLMFPIRFSTVSDLLSASSIRLLTSK